MGGAEISVEAASTGNTVDVSADIVVIMQEPCRFWRLIQLYHATMVVVRFPDQIQSIDGKGDVDGR